MPKRSMINENGYYHVINRGVEKRDIFLDTADHLMFLTLLNEYKSTYHFVIHAYCLMSNHYHLLMEIKKHNLSTIMQKINYKYSLYFNRKYNRSGHLWQGRFRSWFVVDEQYLHTLTEYIEQNPIKAGITNKIGEFAWSSSTTSRVELSDSEMTSIDRYSNAMFIQE